MAIITEKYADVQGHRHIKTGKVKSRSLKDSPFKQLWLKNIRYSEVMGLIYDECLDFQNLGYFDQLFFEEI